jgi:hypothetical protein
MKRRRLCLPATIRTLGGCALVLAALLLSWPGVESVRAEPGESPLVAAPPAARAAPTMCKARDANIRPAADVQIIVKGYSATALAGGKLEGVALNGRGYNYRSARAAAPPPR